MGVLDTIGISKEELDNISDQSDYYVPKPFVGLARVDIVFIRKVKESGAKQLHTNLTLDNGDKIEHQTNLVSGNNKGNKIGFAKQDLKALLFACLGNDSNGSVSDSNTEERTIKYKDEDIVVLELTDLAGKELIVSIQNEESEFQGRTSMKAKIKHYLNTDGMNSSGEDKLESVKNYIDKNGTVLLQKKSKASNRPKQDTGSGERKSSW